MTEPLRIVDDNGELIIPGCKECQNLSAKVAGLEGDHIALTKQLATVIQQRDALKRDREAKMRADKQYPDAEGLFDEWRTECGHPNAEFDAARLRLALSAVRRYKQHREKLSWVIQCGKHLAYVDPQTGERHDSFGLLFRDSEHIEKYAVKWWRYQRRNSGHETPTAVESGDQTKCPGDVGASRGRHQETRP